jgi:hypothetical protein
MSANVTCGIDWASDHHDVALVDADGKLLAKARIGDDADGLTLLLDLLAEHGDAPQDLIPVAIETSRGLLVAALRATGRPVYAINPMAAARYGDRHTVTRKKSDHLDAMVLANILRTDAEMHRVLPADSEFVLYYARTYTLAVTCGFAVRAGWRHDLGSCSFACSTWRWFGPSALLRCCRAAMGPRPRRYSCCGMSLRCCVGRRRRRRA